MFTGFLSVANLHCFQCGTKSRSGTSILRQRGSAYGTGSQVPDPVPNPGFDDHKAKTKL
jgi:hypothetical protein